MKWWITLVGAALFTWTATAEDYPRIETSVNYNYVRFSSGSRNFIEGETTSVPAFSANGGSAQVGYNFNRWLGVYLDAGAVTNNNFAGFSVDNTQAFFMAGPRLSFRKSRFKPYVQGVFGGVYYTASAEIRGRLLTTLPFPIGDEITGRLTANQTKFAMAIGGGLDIKLKRWLAFRPAALDYYYTRISDLRGIGDHSQNNLRYSAGLNFMIGGENPAPVQSTKKCPDGSIVSIDAACPKLNVALTVSANPKELCPGETAQVTAAASGADIRQLSHVWFVNGQAVSQEGSYMFTAKDPDTYTIGLKTSGDKFNPAAAQTTIVVHEYHPPTGTVQANPSQVYVGDKSSLSAAFDGQCGGPISAPRFSASEGSVQGDQFDSSTVEFDPSNHAEQRKTVTITAKASDNKSEGTATTTIDVIKKATAEPIRLPDVLFDHNSARVNNCGKRVLLEQLRAYVERDPTGQVVLVGHTSSDETTANLAQQRALNAAAVITAGTGVCLSVPQSQVQLSWPGVDQNGVSFESSFCQSSLKAGSATNSEMRRVVVWFVPTGGQIPASVTNAQPASATSVGSLGCPK
jgi:outer membrane protein OmpA-like peptidoglycan-associated protein